MEEGYDDIEKFREDHLTIIEEEEWIKKNG
jgi:hypothetical protein